MIDRYTDSQRFRDDLDAYLTRGDDSHLTPDADGTDADLADDARVCDLSRIEAVPSRFPLDDGSVTAFAAEQLAADAREALHDDLVSIDQNLAARCVLDGMRHYSDTIAREIGEPVGAAGSVAARSRPPRALIVAQVHAWGRGEDACVLASNAAYARSQECCACAQLALLSGKATETCAMCRAEGGS